MSGGQACTDQAHRSCWQVIQRKCNFSAFNGGRQTPSDYSSVTCRACGLIWRTKAAYVDALPDFIPPGRPGRPAMLTLRGFTKGTP